MLSNEQIISWAFGARGFVPRLDEHVRDAFKNSIAIVQKNNTDSYRYIGAKDQFLNAEVIVYSLLGAY